MSDSRFLTLGDAVEDENFPEVDLILRRGRHIDRDDATLYAYLSDAADKLEPFYRRFGCELVHASEGYYYLLPTSDKLGRRHLSVPEMLVGQALALLYLDPATLQNGGLVTKQDALSRLASVTGTDALMQAFNPKRKRMDERVAEETVRAKFAEALRRLAALGFIDLLDNDTIKLRSPLMRFAEPVKGEGSSLEALERLVARGELVLGTGDDEEDSEGLDEPSERAPKAKSERAPRPEPEPPPLPPAVADAMADFEQFGAAFDTAVPAENPSNAEQASNSTGDGMSEAARRFAELFPEDDEEELEDDEAPVGSEQDTPPSQPSAHDAAQSAPDERLAESTPEGEPSLEPSGLNGPASEREGEH